MQSSKLSVSKFGPFSVYFFAFRKVNIVNIKHNYTYNKCTDCILKKFKPVYNYSGISLRWLLSTSSDKLFFVIQSDFFVKVCRIMI